MKKTIRLVSLVVMVIVAVCCMQSCSKDSDSATSGKWYLVSFLASDTECTWGEYLKFSGNKLTWRSRKAGKNSYYTYTCTGQEIICVPQDDSEYIIFTIESVDDSRMTTTRTDGIRRKWRR